MTEFDGTSFTCTQMEMKHNPQYAGNSWTSFAKIVRASMQMPKSWIFTQPHKTYYNRHHHPILQFTSVLWNPFSVVFVMIMFPFVIYKALLLKPLVVAQFLGGPLLPHLLQTPEISQLLFVPAASPLTIRKLFLRILCLYYSSSAFLLSGLPCSWRPRPKTPRRTRRARGRKTDLPFF